MESQKRDYEGEISAASEYILSQCQEIKGATCAMVLGSGLGVFVDHLNQTAVIKYKDIPYWKTGSVVGHSSQLVVGTLKKNPNITVVCMQGRLHVYEGHSAYDVAFPVRVFHALGIQNLIITAACGSLNPEYETSDIVLIKDHINMMGVNPLIEHQFKDLPMFVDLSNNYDQDLRTLFKKIALQKGINHYEGVYVAQSGPTFETRAEYKMFHLMGGDVMGMSVIPENIVANQCGIRCLGISVVGNKGLNLISKAPEHGNVLECVKKAVPYICAILSELIPQMQEQNGQMKIQQ